MMKSNSRRVGLILLICTLGFVLLSSGCGKKEATSGNQAVAGQEENLADGNALENQTADGILSPTQEEAQDAKEDAENIETYTDEELIQGEMLFDAAREEEYLADQMVLYDDSEELFKLICEFDQILASDDTEIYFFAVAPHESVTELAGQPVTNVRKGHRVKACLDYKDTYLFARFVPAIKLEGKYVAISSGEYLDNPEVLAINQDPYPEIPSIKGLLVDPVTVGTEKLTDLGLSQAIYNIPLSMIIGESTNPDLETIEFEYDGDIYYFNTNVVTSYDNLFRYFQSKNIYATAIVLNDWNENYPEIIHPKSREKTSSSLYYAFNTEEEKGVKLLEATALFLARRYSDGEHGMVYNWVIANEINQNRVWNYMDTTDLDEYCDSFERGFRIFYNAIKSSYASAGVYYSIDHDWNDNGGDNAKWFNGRELVTLFNEKALQYGNYDWGLAIHPYPNPLTRVNYWSTENDMTPDAEVLTLMNISSLTGLLEQEEFRDTSGEVRSVTVTELGFTSYAGEKLQAAAYAYCYYILEANPYIDAFMLNRETDAWEEMQTGLAFGLYNPDLTDKYALEVFKTIDTDQREQYQEVMLNILGAESMEEALSWAVPQE